MNKIALTIITSFSMLMVSNAYAVDFGPNNNLPPVETYVYQNTNQLRPGMPKNPPMIPLIIIPFGTAPMAHDSDNIVTADAEKNDIVQNNSMDVYFEN